MIWGKTGAGEVGEMLQIFFINYLSVALFLGWPHLCTLRLHAALWKRPKYEILLLWKSKPSKKLPQLGNKRYCSSFPRQLFTKAAAERKPAAVSVNVSHLTPCSHTCCCYTTHCWTLNTLEIPPSPPDSFLPTVSGGWMTKVTAYLSRVHLFVPSANVFFVWYISKSEPDLSNYISNLFAAGRLYVFDRLWPGDSWISWSYYAQATSGYWQGTSGTKTCFPKRR